MDQRATQDLGAEWETLMRAANRGDTAAYARFLREIAPVLRGVIRARAQKLGHDCCEDVLQEVLLAIHLKRHSWREDAPIRPWLFAVTRYKLIDALRARGQRVHLPIADFADSLPAPAGVDPTERSDVERVIGRLDPRSADIVRAIGLLGESISDTGSRLGMSEGAVRVALHRALRTLARLRERLVE